MEFLKEYWFLISSIIIPIATFLIGKYKAKAYDDTKIRNALFGICQAYLLDMCERIRLQGWCSYNTKQTLTNLYGGYHGLGGDQFITAMFNDCINLPDFPPEIDIKQIK